ncbi:MAG: sialidase family protein, partial [Ignavibacteriota bacterium]
MKKYIILAIFISTTLFAQVYTTPLRVNQDKSLRADRSPMMKLDRAGNIYIAWVSGANSSGGGPISMAVSTDGGMTFPTQSVVCADADCNSNFQRTAQLVLDTKNNIHVVWMGNRVNAQPDIWYTRSTDQGKSWSHPVSVCDADDSSKYAQDFPSIACDSADNIYVSFLDMRMTQRKKASTPLLYFTRSTDGGKSWSMNMRADRPPGDIGGTCECCSEQMAVGADGHIYIAYRSNINNVRDIWLARSYDRGSTFEASLKISSGDWFVQACPVTGPHISLDDLENAHIVWRDARDDSMRSRLYYATVSKEGTSSPANTAFDSPDASLPDYPDIALYDGGKYSAIAYETFDFGMRYILTSPTGRLVDNRPISANGNSRKYFSNLRFGADGTRYLCW